MHIAKFERFDDRDDLSHSPLIPTSCRRSNPVSSEAPGLAKPIWVARETPKKRPLRIYWLPLSQSRVRA
jgi:hypothetical protein